MTAMTAASDASYTATGTSDKLIKRYIYRMLQTSQSMTTRCALWDEETQDGDWVYQWCRWVEKTVCRENDVHPRLGLPSVALSGEGLQELCPKLSNAT